ncbi:MAG TPA: amidase [Acetobacteraceae bacterium]|nr:amidase [Acetobacteraceae bacterium]
MTATKNNPLALAGDSPLGLGVAAMAAAVRSGRISARALAEASLAQAERVQARCNAFCLILEGEALARADAIDAAIRAGRDLPLAGVPFAAKDVTPTAGHLTTLGSWSSGDFVPEETALLVRRLEAAGAVLIGKTTSPEFAHSSFTYSPRWGDTLNPIDPRRTTGGSSGGSAAAVAGFAVPIAEGTDMGGSVRIPASFCGLVGLKPSLGRIPMTILPSLFDNLSHFGPLARTVADAVAFMAVASGPSDEDPFSLPLAFDAAACKPVDLSGRRFALSVDLGFYAVDPEVERVVLEAAEAFRRAGAIVEPVRLPWTREVVDRWSDLWAVFMSGYFGERRAAHADKMDPVIVDYMRQGDAMSATHYKRIEILRSRMWREMMAVLGDYEALLCPSCAVPAPPASRRDFDYFATLPDGRFAGLDMTCPFNMVPALPALSLPAGTTAEGLPVGLQIVGRRYADEAVLALAGGMELVLAG